MGIGGALKKAVSAPFKAVGGLLGLNGNNGYDAGPDVEIDPTTQGLINSQTGRANRSETDFTNEALQGANEQGQSVLDQGNKLGQEQDQAQAMGSSDQLSEALTRRSRNRYSDESNARKVSQDIKSHSQKFNELQQVSSNLAKAQALKQQNYQRKAAADQARKQARGGAIGSVLGIGGAIAGGIAGGPGGAAAGSMIGQGLGQNLGR